MINVSYFGKHYYVKGFSDSLILIRLSCKNKGVVFDGKRNYIVPLIDILWNSSPIEDKTIQRCTKCYEEKNIECFKKFKQSPRRSKTCLECLTELAKRSQQRSMT